jgi:hypothetical protein
MNQINNPSAFPLEYEEYNSTGLLCKRQEFGMTLRDYFAAKAMQASLANQEMWTNLISDYKSFGNGLTALEYVAKEAYELADAMLKQR